MTAGKNLTVNGDRLWDSLMDMAKIGPGIAGGNNRRTLTDEDAEGRRLFQRWCEAAGLTMGVVSLDEALELAREAGVDLVEVNPKADPPICRLRDTAAMEKKAAAMERKAVKRSRTEKGQAKKVRLSPRTDDGSVLVKAAQIAKMLRKGQTVHVFVWAKNAKDRVEQHETAMPLLGRRRHR